MRKSYNQKPAGETKSDAFKLIETGNFGFYMRNKTQQEYHPDNVATFTHEHYRFAYILQDMAGLCDSDEISNFIFDIANHLRTGDYHRISEDDLKYTMQFIRHGREKYQNTDYVDLEALVN